MVFKSASDRGQTLSLWSLFCLSWLVLLLAGSSSKAIYNELNYGKLSTPVSSEMEYCLELKNDCYLSISGWKPSNVLGKQNE